MSDVLTAIADAAAQIATAPERPPMTTADALAQVAATAADPGARRAARVALSRASEPLP